MAACWPLQMPPTPKAVLVSLADNANDQGHCWPSISTICERTCFGRTAVIAAIQWLEDHGAVKADRSNGRHTSYVITPGQYQSASRTGTPPEPVRQANGTSPPRGRDQSGRRTLTVKNRKEPSTTTNHEPSVLAEPPAAVQLSSADEKICEAVVAKYHAMLPKCQRVGVLNPKRRKRILSADKLARKVCADQGWQFDRDWFWQNYFAECASDPWMRGEVPHPKNPAWKQNLEVLIAEDRFARVMDDVIATQQEAA